MARRVGHYLEAKGLAVNRLTNADHFNHPETRIYYQKGYHEAASHLADQLPAVGVKDIREEKRFDRPSIKIKLLIGKDILPYHTWFQEGDPS